MKGKKLLMGALTLAMLCTATAGGSLLVAHAATTPTVGAFYEAWSGTKYSVNGTSATEAENKTQISYQWTAVEYNRLLVHVTGASSSSTVSVKLKPDADMALQIWACNAEGDWDAAYGKLVENDSMTANTLYEKTGTLSGLGEATELYLGFYFDSGVTTDIVKTVTVEELTVDGVSYQKTPYTAPVETPDAEFKAYSDWTATNATFSANTLAKLPETDAQYADAVDNGAGKITITDASKPATIEIPFTEAIAAWPTAWTHLHLKLKWTGLSAVMGHIEEPAEADANLFTNDILGEDPAAWNATRVKSGTEGYFVVSIDLNTYFKDHQGAISKLVFVTTPEAGASAAELDIAGMAFGGASAPVFINDPEYVPDLKVGDWVTWNTQVTLEPSGTVDGYTGATVAYDPANTAETELQFHVAIADFDPELYPTLTVGFYTDAAITLGVGYDWALITGSQREEYAPGHYFVDLDMTKEKAGDFPLRFYLQAKEAAATVAEDPVQSHIVVDTVIFHDGEGASILTGEIKAPLTDTVVEAKDGKIEVKFDAKNGGYDNYISIPVENWYSFDRYLHLNITLSHATALGVWGANAFGDPETLQMAHKLLPAGTYDLWLDAAPSGFANNGKNNNIMLYFDVQNVTEGSLVKTATVNTLEFARTAEKVSSPNGDVVKVDYLNGKATYEATYEVATDKDFQTVFASGSAVTPGMKLYIRKADGSSATTELVLPVTTLTEDMITFSTITESIIRTNSFAGYQFRLGEDGKWMDNMGSWGNLKAGTEYTLYVRIKASETAFASETISFKVSTKSATTPGGETPGGTTPGGTTPGGTTPGGTTPGGTTPGGETKPGNTDNAKNDLDWIIGLAVGAAVVVLIAGAAVILFIDRKKR